MMKKLSLAVLSALMTTTAFAQTETQVAQPYKYDFTIVKEHPATPVKDQAKT